MVVERLVRFFFHAGLCLFEIVGGVCAGCGWGDGSRMKHSAIAAPRCRADRIIFHLVFGCALTGQLLYLSERLRSPAAPCAPYGGAPCSTLTFCPVVVFESRKLAFWRRKWRVFRFWGPFWGVFGVLGRTTGTFISFSVVASHLREGVEVLGITPHLLNVSVLGTTHGLYSIGVLRAQGCA